MTQRIFVSAGEASGDALGASLLERMQAQRPDLLCSAVGGRALAACAELVVDSSTWGAVGIGQSLRVAPRAARGLALAKDVLSDGEPGLLIPIDFGFFNVRLARFAKSMGWKVLYFMPPGSWRRDKQGRDLPQIADAVVTPFPWSAETLRGMGANAHWFGHPLKQLLLSTRSGESGIPDERIAVLPGSRSHEIERNLPLIARALPATVQAEFAVASSLHASYLEARWKRLAPHRSDLFTRSDAPGVLTRSRAAIVCSGTATLEAALLERPMVVVYSVGAATVLQARLAGFRPEFVSLPNLILQRAAVPEFVGRAPQPIEIARALELLLRESPERDAQLRAFNEIATLLGRDDAIDKTADLALSMLR